ncbi:hypothetical protein PGTUg99_025394 [Puccinia graminis f. sp. tritici]|uniref:Uncharacterized protein n=1 Tax=Puccinia graminis f. sp. tritici TaxID=56615 RepID=A0A5B0PHD7_PUCGR|nr:hypothetical protein PGTUg99_025394 [Puccinia graminis f. sp. tritici]
MVIFSLIFLIQGISLSIGLPTHTPPFVAKATSPTAGSGTVEYRISENHSDQFATCHVQSPKYDLYQEDGLLEEMDPNNHDEQNIRHEDLFFKGQSKEHPKVTFFPNGQVELKDGSYTHTIFPSLPLPKENWYDITCGLVKMAPVLARMSILPLVYFLSSEDEPAFSKVKKLVVSNFKRPCKA